MSKCYHFFLHTILAALDKKNTYIIEGQIHPIVAKLFEKYMCKHGEF